MSDAPPRIGKLFVPERWTSILGTTYAKREHLAVLIIGTHRWDRWHLGRLGCPHPVAAASLNRVVQELGITTLAGLARQVRQIGNYKGIGTTAYALALAILGEHGFDLDAVHNEDVTYITIKGRARRQAVKDKRQRKKPRRAGPPSDTKDATV